MALQIAYILKQAKRLRASRLLVQIPEGLKPQALEIVSQLERAGLEVFLSCEPTYGGCDLLDCEAERLGCQAIKAYHQGIPLKEYAEDHKELAAALAKWGSVRPI